MGVRTHESRPGATSRRDVGPGARPAILVSAVAFVLLVANGRAIGDPGETGPAGFLLSAASAAAGAILDLDATGRALVGKLVAAAFAAAAAGFLFAAAARRRPLDDARWAAFSLALGSTLAAAAQSLTGEAPAACAVAAAVWLLARADASEDAGLAARSGLPLAMAVAFQPSTLGLAVAMALAGLVRWRTAALPLLAWALPGAALAVVSWLTRSSPSPSPPDPGALALLLSPAKGALVFAPAAIVGLAGLLKALRPSGERVLWDQRRPTRWLPAACAVAAVAHFAALALAGGWSEGVFWGPRLVSPAWPLLLLYVPEGLSLLKLAGTLLVVLSALVQALGAFAYDGRWDRLHRGPGGGLASAAWDLARSPVPFQLKEGVVRPSLPAVEGRRLVVREHALLAPGETGSFVRFGEGRLRPTGADETMTGLRLEGGARVAGERLELLQPGDAIAFRVREGARPRRLELRVVGRGRGTLVVREAGLFVREKLQERGVEGAFRIRLPYAFAASGAADLAVGLKAGGPVAIESVALVPPGDPEDVLRLP